MRNQTPNTSRSSPKARSKKTLIAAKNQMRALFKANFEIDPTKARVAQTCEAVLLFALGYHVDLTEEVEAFTDLILKEMPK